MIEGGLDRWITRCLAYLGGAAALVKVLEWIRNRPQLVGQIEKAIVYPDLERGPDALHPNVVIQAYISNRRAYPAAVASWSLVVWHRRARYDGVPRPLPNQRWFERHGEMATAIPLDETTASAPIGYGSITRGWLHFSIPVLLHGAMMRGPLLVLIATDALGGKHVLRYRIPPEGAI